jgi:hypothetical protein
VKTILLPVAALFILGIFSSCASPGDYSQAQPNEFKADEFNADEFEPDGFKSERPAVPAASDLNLSAALKNAAIDIKSRIPQNYITCLPI